MRKLSLVAITFVLALTPQASYAQPPLPPAAQSPAAEDLRIGGGIGQTTSADGRYTSITNFGGLQLVDLATGKSQNVVDLKSASVRLRVLPHFSAITPKADRIAFLRITGTRSELQIVNADGTGQRTLLGSDDHRDLFLPADWSADGRSLLVIKNTGSTSAVCTLRGSSCRPVFEADPGSTIKQAKFSGDASTIAFTLQTASVDNKPTGQVRIFATPIRKQQVTEISPAATGLAGWIARTRTVAIVRATSAGGHEVVAVDVDKPAAPQSLATLPASGYGHSLGITPAGDFFYTNAKLATGVHELDLATGSAQPLRTGEGRLERHAWSPDGKSLFYVQVKEGGEQRLLLWDRTTGTEKVLAITRKVISRSVSWTPDGKFVLVPIVDERPHIGRLNLQTSIMQVFGGAVARQGSDRIAWPKLSQDGKYLYFAEGLNASGDWDLMELDVETQATRVVGAVDQRFDLSPDSKRLALATRNGIQIRNVDGTESKQIVAISPGDRVVGVTWSASGQTLYFARARSRDLYEVPADGSSEPKVIFSGINTLPEVNVHPDGRAIALVLQASTNNVMRLRLSSKQAQKRP